MSLRRRRHPASSSSSPGGLWARTRPNIERGEGDCVWCPLVIGHLVDVVHLCLARRGRLDAEGGQDHSVQGGCYRGCGSARTPLSRRSGLNTRPFAFLTQPWLETRVWFPSTSQPGTGFQISPPSPRGPCRWGTQSQVHGQSSFGKVPGVPRALDTISRTRLCRTPTLILIERSAFGS
jgi:hypothetical protein